MTAFKKFAGTAVVGVAMLVSRRAFADTTKHVDHKCIADPAKAKACEMGQQETCEQDTDEFFYCPNAQTPGLCEKNNLGLDCTMRTAVKCGHKFGCGSWQPVKGPAGEEFVECSGGPDACS